MLLKRKSRKIIVAIFAHPDDEAFGPSGTIAKLAKINDVYLICATRGEAGEGDSKKLAQVRTQELLESANILGVKQVYFLKYKDGTLSNLLYHQIAKDIEKLLVKLRPEIVITVDPTGMSGHLDHVAVCYITTFVFYKLPFVKTLMYWCLTKENKRLFTDKYFIYTPDGYNRDQIDRVISVEKYWDTKLSAIKSHKSQLKDASRMLKMLENSPREEYFIVKTK